MRLRSHVFASLQNAQVAVLDTYKALDILVSNSYQT